MLLTSEAGNDGSWGATVGETRPSALWEELLEEWLEEEEELEELTSESLEEVVWEEGVDEKVKAEHGREGKRKYLTEGSGSAVRIIEVA